MKLLLDTHLLAWAMGEPARLGPALRELVIKAGLGREGFQVQSADPHRSCGAVGSASCAGTRFSEMLDKPKES